LLRWSLHPRSWDAQVLPVRQCPEQICDRKSLLATWTFCGFKIILFFFYAERTRWTGFPSWILWFLYSSSLTPEYRQCRKFPIRR
jgi:hypothetical protein